MPTRTVTGDLLFLCEQGQFDVIVHGCNCFCTMGASIALSIRKNFPEAYAADIATKSGDERKLGSYSHAKVTRGSHTFTVVNAYTQFTFGRGHHVNYDAITRVFRTIGIVFASKRIAYPMIGAGLAGGDWQQISSIIDHALENVDHTLVVLLA